MNSRLKTLSRFLTVLLASGAFRPALLDAQASSAGARGYSAEECPPCAEWNAPAAPVKLHGNTWYVGTRGLAAILITSDSAHVLIDAGLSESAEPIMASIRALGFRVEDIELIVTSHAHYDDAGGVAEIQRASGAFVAASASSARVLRSGELGPDDPQFGIALAFPPVHGAHAAPGRIEILGAPRCPRCGTRLGASRPGGLPPIRRHCANPTCPARRSRGGGTVTTDSPSPS